MTTTSFTGIAMHVEAIKQAVVEALEEIKAADITVLA